MRLKSSSKVGKSVVRIAAAAFLASAATGCSSDATRFSGLFSKSDNLTTASIPQRQGAGSWGQAPVPQSDVGTGAQPTYQASAAQPARAYPPAQSYPSPARTSASPARVASAPVSVQRAELAPPTAAPLPTRDPQTRKEALAQPFPGKVAAATPQLAKPQHGNADNVLTGTTKAVPGPGWTTVNAPTVTMRPGETAAVLSRRYGVPEKEILAANGGSVHPGQTVVIPKFSASGNAAKMAAGAIDLPREGDRPAPGQQQNEKVAVLPGASASRDKNQGEVGKLTPPSGGKPVPPGGTYVVKPGDSLAKIAKATGVSVDQLKAANNLGEGSIRVGQTLNLGGQAAADSVKTASIVPPAKPAARAAAKPAAATPKAEPAVAQAPAKPAAAEKAPAAQTQQASLSDVEKKGDDSPAPSATGIGKYRWPVTGAVIAGYGQNVNGSRNDGIDISVPEGTPIKAAENGVVIYAGNGLKQLGNTVLVRHDDGKVTVYGHANNIVVSRGQKVQRGQAIATSGMSGDAKRPQVHFEVRKDATPVNPMTFLE
ncbi:peptidoglycan DD-metalloendopeptidase family protein [Rhizobium oryzicola]|uniref:Peptidoglycan DD-metalloendopeptidase family protein n=1 Tax=Rhizobium oryzicola TaxID=1232668 RepID=A0ABT8T3U3_9HYPH|nr:peptidoglycan DD-metalloendopeptidase family protein [Rhizobium oryzicola]MDO1585109.1 peptidoglycan DD-metalloendopeptidase family protein [Rhizobium oryzicola]